tara:strand:+ start:127 stop:1014 length:888 start_codon:yes stop_codon:yes gene_type:complete
MATSLFESPQGEVKGLPSTAGTGSRAQKIDTALEQGMAAARRRAQEARAVPGAVEEATRDAITEAREQKARQFAANRRLGVPLAQSLGVSGTGSMVAASDEARARSQAAMDVAQARLSASQAEQDAIMSEAGFLAEQEALASAAQAKLTSFNFEMQNTIASAEGRQGKAAVAGQILSTIDPSAPEYETQAANTVLAAITGVGHRVGMDTILALRQDGFTYEDMLEALQDYAYSGKDQRGFVSAMMADRFRIKHDSQSDRLADDFNNKYKVGGGAESATEQELQVYGKQQLLSEFA